MMRPLLALAIALLAACSISHRTGDYACTKQSDCGNGRVCTDGFCVLPGSVDAPNGSGNQHDAPQSGCPTACSSCNTGQKTCTIDCRTKDCTQQVSCPAGYRCDIECNTDNACRNGVNCQLGISCMVNCSGKASCENVQCGLGPCDVACSGTGACKNVSCGNSCACDITCTGSQSCSSGIQCTSLACRSGLGCTSTPSLCHSCM